MEILNSIVSWVFKKRMYDIEHFMEHPHDVQATLLQDLLSTAQDTDFGHKFGFRNIKNSNQFRQKVPLSTYEELFPYIDRMLKGEQNVLWPSEIKWFAKSSGTTNDRSKFIPVSQEAMNDCHFKGGKDLYAIYSNNNPDTRIFTGKGLAIGGSQQVNQFAQNPNSYYGDVSAVLMKNLPFYVQWYRTPSLEVALMSEWEAKIEKMAQQTMDENVTHLLGVPTWTIVLIQRILEISGKRNIHDVWPGLELFIHGAVAFDPYQELFHQLAPGSGMKYLETYNASEGFFGIQDQSNSKDMLLMLDYGVYYEFIPFENIHDQQPKTIDLADVEIGKNYALVITTNAGLWRYVIGDTIKFTSKSPYRIRITGRTKHFINAFGEELIIENADHAITFACEQTGAILEEYTAGPRYIGEGNKGSHEWVIEFQKIPDDPEKFKLLLDEKLREVNSDYDAKRYKDMALEKPLIHIANKGTFYEWMKKRGKIGGQNKVPRLANTRDYLDEIVPKLQAALS
ncbi:MAG: GH3 auxin-responsive promoter family protein [Cyclobacteriaceae bacterium]